MNIVLWLLQIVIAAFFLMAGYMKTFSPAQALEEKMHVKTKQVPAYRTLGILELLAVAGLILPLVLNIAPWMTGITGIGTAMVMMGAIVIHFKKQETPQVMLC